MYNSATNAPRIVVSLGFGPPVPAAGADQAAAYASSLWLYETSEDTHIQCEGAGYFSNAGTLGMRVGDLVLVSSSVANGGGITLHAVTSIVAATQPGFTMPGAGSIGSASGAQNSVATGLVATGSTLGTALLLGADINLFGTVAASTGAILPTMNPGDCMTVVNQGSNPLALYPPTASAKINALGAGAAYSIATATPLCEITCLSPTAYLARQSA